MDSIIEVQRQTHEEVERLERALSTILSHNYKTHKAHLSAEHKASDILERIVDRSVSLQKAYEDIDGMRKTEIDLLIAPTEGDGLDEFYVRLKKIKDHHARYPNQVTNAFEIELNATLEDAEELDNEEFEDNNPVNSLFSGEERYGLCLDVYASHTQYNNFKHISKRLQYLQYLDVLAAVESLPLHSELSKESRHTKEYEHYLAGLYNYLLSFSKRTRPLTDIDAQRKKAEAEFDQLWEEGKVPGWEVVKNTGAIEGIWCPACQRQYAKQTVYDAHLSSKKHQKAAAKLEAEGASTDTAAQTNGTNPHPNGNGVNATNNAGSKSRQSARLTHLVTSLLVSLLPTIAETKANVERRFSLTAREREEELVQDAPVAAPVTADGGAQEEEPEEEERIYNPLKLPLGWDGKPIPYWLYKLHGLGVEYRCEICSDYVYMGRKNFERHFQEARHAFGMRALGLPNTKHFHEITKIQDALALAEKLKKEGRKEISQNETTEEMEDEEGNVYDRKTYEDLKKQGII